MRFFFFLSNIRFYILLAGRNIDVESKIIYFPSEFLKICERLQTQKH